LRIWRLRAIVYKTIYEDTEKEVKVNLERRIQQVKDDVKIEQFADQQVPNPALDQNVKA